MSSSSSHGSMSTGSRCSLSASSRGSLNSLNYSASNPDVLHMANSNEYFPSSYHPTLNQCPPIYETTKFESRNPDVRLESNFAATTALIASLQSKNSISSRDSMSLSSMSPPISPLHADRDRASFIGSYQSSQLRSDYGQFGDPSSSDRMQPCYQVIIFPFLSIESSVALFQGCRQSGNSGIIREFRENQGIQGKSRNFMLSQRKSREKNQVSIILLFQLYYYFISERRFSPQI